MAPVRALIFFCCTQDFRPRLLSVAPAGADVLAGEGVRATGASGCDLARVCLVLEDFEDSFQLAVLCSQRAGCGRDSRARASP